MIGESNPFPTQIGGPPSRIDRMYQVLRSIVGVNGHSDGDETIEAYWRRAKAEALAALETFDERAVMQAFPHIATDHVSLYEQVLGIDTDETLSFQQRRDGIVSPYTSSPQAWTSAVIEAVQEIDDRITIMSRDWENATVTMPGRYFEPYSPAGQEYDPGGARRATAWPNANDKNEARIFFDIGNGQAPSRDILRKTSQAIQVVRSMIPAWNMVRMCYAIGFYLDSSLLDATGFGT